jgi:hypothetical protein
MVISEKWGLLINLLRHMSVDESRGESSFASFDEIKFENKIELNIKQILC